MSIWGILALALTALAVIAVVVALVVQGYPESGRSEPDADTGLGPTGDAYPSGSRPAGPEAEDMDLPPSSREQDEADRQD